MLKRGLKNLSKRIGNLRRVINQRYWSRHVTHSRFAANSYSAYALAKVQRAPLGTMRTLFENHLKDDKSGLPSVHLGVALKLQGDHKYGNKAIAHGLNLLLKPKIVDKADWYLGDYGTYERDMAMAYAVLARHNMLNKKAGEVLLKLSLKLKNRRYLSTQEKLSVFLAGYTVMTQKGVHWQAIVKGGKKTDNIDREGRFTKVYSFNAIQNGIQVQSKSSQPLYAMLHIDGYTTTPPKHDEKKIEIVRTLYDMKGKRIRRNRFKVGELLVAHLSVRSNKNTKNGLVVDLLPAGFEVENLNLSKGETLSNIKIQGVSPS
jgi:hypothetical protein